MSLTRVKTTNGVALDSPVPLHLHAAETADGLVSSLFLDSASQGFASAEKTDVEPPPQLSEAAAEAEPADEFDGTQQPVLRQVPIELTLSVTALFQVAVAMILALQVLDRLVTQVAIAVTPLLVLLYCDYANFLGLGPGGVPSNINGYITATYLRLWALRNNYSTHGLHRPDRPATGLFSRRPITHRPGPLPKVVGVVPQRMITQQGTLHHNRLLRASFRALAATIACLAVQELVEVFCQDRSCVRQRGDTSSVLSLQR